jgi:hypothetical protein
MSQVWNWFWLTVAFVAELVALVAFALWGWSVGGSTGGRLLLAGAAPAVAGVAWGVFAAPQAPVQVPALALLVKLLVFGAAVLALLATNHPWLAIALAATAVLSSLLSTPPA